MNREPLFLVKKRPVVPLRASYDGLKKALLDLDGCLDSCIEVSARPGKDLKQTANAVRGLMNRLGTDRTKGYQTELDHKKKVLRIWQDEVSSFSREKNNG